MLEYGSVWSRRLRSDPFLRRSQTPGAVGPVMSVSADAAAGIGYDAAGAFMAVLSN